ncbi:MAG: Ig-like domain repeat protein, partial [Thermoplasmata archaeon]
LETLHYYFRITDSAGNWLVGPQADVDVTDNDSPTLNADNSDSLASLGDTFTFNVDITDNIGMNETLLVYWFGTDPPIEVVMSGIGPYNYQITIPSDLMFKLHYYFKASDIFDNWLMGPQVDVNVTDNYAPTNLLDTSDTTATTGDAYNFVVNATDNIGVSEVYVVYWFGTDSPTNATMTGIGPYTLSITIPSDSLDTLHYYFTIADEAGNWLVGSQVDVPVQDNDDPTFVSDDSDDDATTGDAFTFKADFADNIDIANAYVVYWFGGDLETTAIMIGADPYTKEIIIPAGSEDTLHYYLKAVDSVGNEYIGEQQDITVTDNDPPTLIYENSDTTAITGGSFEFNATFEDNIGIAEVEVFYWFGEDSVTSAIMTGTDVYTHSITIPNDSIEPLHFYIVARDSHGNALQIGQRSVPITDNILGTLSNDQSDTSGKEDKEFNFQIDASDNVGISQVTVTYWFGEDDSKKKTMLLTATDGTYTGSIVPSESGTLHYYFQLVDEAGNTQDGPDETASIASAPKEETEENIFPWIIVVILIVIIILLFLLTRKKKEAEEIPAVPGAAPGVGPEELEEPGEEAMPEDETIGEEEPDKSAEEDVEEKPEQASDEESKPKDELFGEYVDEEGIEDERFEEEPEGELKEGKGLEDSERDEES